MSLRPGLYHLLWLAPLLAGTLSAQSAGSYSL